MDVGMSLFNRQRNPVSILSSSLRTSQLEHHAGCFCHTFSQQTHTTASYAAHVAFYIWCHADKPADDVHACARIVSDILSKHSLEGMQEFVHYVVPDVVGQKIALEVFCDALLADDKELLHPTQLHRHLSMSMFVLGRVPVLSGVPTKTRRRALYALARIFQRYYCNGDMEGVPEAPRRIAQVVLNCLQQVL